MTSGPAAPFNTCILCKRAPCVCSDAKKTSDLVIRMRMDLGTQEALDVMGYFMEKIWRRGSRSTLESAVVELRSREMHEAAEVLAGILEEP